jgi:hypothetical protein
MASTTAGATNKDADAIHFRGIPTSLAGIIADGASQTGDMMIAMRGYPAKDSSLDVHVLTDVDPRIIRVMLPADVAPGSYDGTLTDGTRERAVVLDVEPAPHLRVVPEQMRIEAKPGDTVKRTVTVINGGNVPVNLRRVQAFGVFMAGGVERALRRGYVHTLSADERRVDIIANHLADAHGGLVKMTLTSGSGSIAPGAMQSLDLEVKIPTGLAAGSVYGGNWEPPGTVYPVTITVPGEPPEVADEVENGDSADSANDKDSKAPATKRSAK